MTPPFLPGCLVTVYASFERREYRGKGVVVGRRCVLTVAHLVDPKALRPSCCRRIFVDDYPRRLARAEVMRRVPSQLACIGDPQGHLRGIFDDVVALRFLRDEGKRARTREFFADQIAEIGEGPPRWILAETGLTRYPAETRAGVSGSPLFNEAGELVGLHAGRSGYPAECWPPTYSPVTLAALGRGEAKP